MMMPLIVLVVALVMMACEVARPGRSWREWPAGGCGRHAQRRANRYGVPGWRRLGRLDVAPSAVVGRRSRHHRRALVGYLVITFIYYWWHRWRHESDFLWPMAASGPPQPAGPHRDHHQLLQASSGAARQQILLAVHPLSARRCRSASCGRRRAADRIAELFYHWNVPTPYWRGLHRPTARKSFRPSSGKRCIRTITRTFRYGTCCSAPSGIRAAGRRAAASDRRRNTSWFVCWPAWM